MDICIDSENKWLSSIGIRSKFEQRKSLSIMECYQTFASFPNDLYYTAIDLARNHYFLSKDNKFISCDSCDFSIDVNFSALLLGKHRQFKSTCTNIVNNLLRDRLPHNIDICQMVPTEPNCRLPARVQVKSRNGCLESATIIKACGHIEKTNSQPPSTATSSQKQLFLTSSLPPLVCHNEDYDTYDGRLTSYLDWPRSSPVHPEDLAKAGFYYTHYGDKTKCPYCCGAVYNWEKGDDAFGEHQRHYPHCNFLKHYTYNALSKPVPDYMPRTLNTSSDVRDHPSVQIIISMGYPLKLVLDVVHSLKLEMSQITTNVILDAIFQQEQENGSSLLNFKSIQLDNDIHMLEGAVGGLYTDEAINSDSDMDLEGAVGGVSDGVAEIESERNDRIGNDDLCLSDVDSGLSDIENEECEVKNASYDMQTFNNVENQYKDVSLLDAKSEETTREYVRLYKISTCRVCREARVDTLMLPCRHLVACNKCAENIDDCCDCGEEIIGTVKVFFT